MTRSQIWATVATVAVVLGAACAGDGGADATLSPEAQEGREIYNSSGCAGCHGRAGEGGVGPELSGLPGTERELVDGTTVIADREYIIRSIMEPSADIVAGYPVRMPDNRLSESEVEAVVAYIEALQDLNDDPDGAGS